MSARRTLWQKLDDSVDRGPSPDDCWLWLGAKDRDGYGRVRTDAGMTTAHRAFYVLLVGPIPVGLQLDHLCRVRDCVNPSHLEPVTARINTLRGEGSAAKRSRQTHCKNGHELSGMNVHLCGPQGHRRCQTCHREYVRARRAEKRAAAPEQWAFMWSEATRTA